MAEFHHRIPIKMNSIKISAPEIQEHYNNQFSNETGLVLWIPFAEGSGNYSNDYSGLGNHGNLTGFNESVHAGAGDTGSSGWTTFGRPNYANPTPGKAGQGYVFKGIDDYIEIEWQ